MRIARLTGILLACAAASWAEVAVSMGANGQLSLPGILPAGIEPWVKAEGDFLFPISEEASFLLDASGRIGYGLPDPLVNWDGSASAAFSWRGERLFWKLGARAAAEGEAIGQQAYMSIASDAMVSLDLSVLTLSFVPGAHWATDATGQFGFDGELDGVLAVGEEGVLRAKCKAGMERPGTAETAWFAEGVMGFTWYSPALAVFSAEAGYRRNASPAPETVTIDGTAVTIPSADSYHEAKATPAISFAIGRDLLFAVRAPVWFRLWDHGPVGDGTLIPDPEWAVGISPTGSLRIDLCEFFALKVSAAADLVFSNSAYREGSAVYLTLEGVLTLGGR